MIHYFQSSQTGAPQLTGLAGSMIAILNACLINGFNLRTLTGITRDGNVATVTADGGHGYREQDIVLIAGANQAAYNGPKRIRAVSTNSFQFDVEGEPQSPATGSLSAKIAPLDWEQPFAAADKAVYRSRDPSAASIQLRIDETPLAGDVNYGRGTLSCLAQMWESLTDIDNGIGKTETFWRKSNRASGDARPWLLIGDSKRFWLCVSWSEYYLHHYMPYYFGHFSSFKAGDAYNYLLSGYTELGYNNHNPSDNHLLDWVAAVGTAHAGNGAWMPRAHTQLGSSVSVIWVSGVGYQTGVSMGMSNIPFPNPVDNGIYVMPMLIQERTGPSLRGRLPGLLTPLHAIAAEQPTRYPGFVLDGSERELLIVPATQSNGAARMAFDLTGPWD
jgi:hypothetical protein